MDEKEKRHISYTHRRILTQLTSRVTEAYSHEFEKTIPWKWNNRHPTPDGGKRTSVGKMSFSFSSLFRLQAKPALA